MSKKLKIKFWKAEKALAMQILKQEGLPKRKEEGGIVYILTTPNVYRDLICLRGDRASANLIVDAVHFNSNQERDEYLDKITNAITDELFTSNGELKVGEMCEVSDDKKHWKKRVYAGKSARELGLDRRYIAMRPEDGISLIRWKYARPIAKRIEPKVEENGEVITYTWEKE